VSVTIGMAQRPCEGETACGDSYTLDLLGGGVLLSVVDGLGHGPNAQVAADAFTQLVREDVTSPIEVIMEAARQRLSPTRGAAAALLRIDEESGVVRFCGVGNVEMHAVSDVKMHPVCAPGIVGHHVRKLLTFEFELPREAFIAVFTDGISSRLKLEQYSHLEPQEAADLILKEHGKMHDDATCVVVHYTRPE
jgi:hypothetical protein